MTTRAPVPLLSLRRLAATTVASILCLGIGVATMPEQLRISFALKAVRGPPCAEAAQTTRCLVKRANALRKAADYDGAIALSRKVISREPMNLVGLETLARSIDPRQAREQGRLIETIARLSKHSAYAHSDLMMKAYSAERPADLLYHADILLRWAEVTPDTVYESMLPYLTDESGRVATARKLASAPPWRADFLRYVAAKADPATALAFAATLNRMGLRQTPVESEALVDRLLDENRYNDLRRFRSVLLSPWEANALVYDGAFDGLEGPDLLIWKTLSVSGGEAILGTVDTDHPGTLLLRHDLFSSSDWMARQLTVLTAGSYRISLAARGLDDQGSKRFVIEVACRGGASIIRVPILTDGDKWVTSAGNFTVPAEACPTQWVAFAPVTGDRVESAQVLVDRVSITRVTSEPPAQPPLPMDH